MEPHKACFERLKSEQPQLVAEIRDAIEAEIGDANSVWSRQLGSKILPHHDDFCDECGPDLAGPVFGLVLQEILISDGWEQKAMRDKGEVITWYTR